LSSPDGIAKRWSIAKRLIGDSSGCTALVKPSPIALPGHAKFPFPHPEERRSADISELELELLENRKVKPVRDNTALLCSGGRPLD
jgi:hypothetical protein